MNDIHICTVTGMHDVHGLRMQYMHVTRYAICTVSSMSDTYVYIYGMNGSLASMIASNAYLKHARSLICTAIFLNMYNL